MGLAGSDSVRYSGRFSRDLFPGNHPNHLSGDEISWRVFIIR